MRKSPNSLGYSAIVDALSKSGDVEVPPLLICMAAAWQLWLSVTVILGMQGAERWLQNMLDAGVEPDVVCFNMLLGQAPWLRAWYCCPGNDHLCVLTVGEAGEAAL